MISMYAIANCDTVKKARKFLDGKGIEYTFIDFKKIPPTKEQIKRWCEFMGELPVNKRGTTYRKFKDEFEALAPAKKIDFLIQQSSMIKRPVLEKNNKTIYIGFDLDGYTELEIG